MNIATSSIRPIQEFSYYINIINAIIICYPYHLTGHLRNCRNRSVLGKQRALLHSTLNIESTWHVVGIPKGERH